MMGGMQWAVREASDGDACAVAVLNGVVQTLHHEHHPERFKPADPDAFLPIVDQWLRSEVTSVLVAVDDSGDLLGYVVGVKHRRPDHPLSYAARVVELDQLVVTPSARGHGVGSALTEAVLQWAAQLGADSVELTTWTFNDTARQLFTGAGFAPTSMRMSQPVHRAGVVE